MAKRIEMKLREQDSICQRNQHMNGILNKMIVEVLYWFGVVFFVKSSAHPFRRRISEVLIPYMAMVHRIEY